jgi:predicted CoA-binding protein
MALRLLRDKGYPVIPVHPKVRRIERVPVVNDLGDIALPVHTLTLYVGAERVRPMIDAIVALKPGRVIFNPGTESHELERRLKDHRIECIHGCTLVMLRTGQF